MGWVRLCVQRVRVCVHAILCIRVGRAREGVPVWNVLVRVWGECGISCNVYMYMRRIMRNQALLHIHA